MSPYRHFFLLFVYYRIRDVLLHSYAAAEGLIAKSTDELAYGFIQVANEAMCRPIRALTQVGGIAL